MVQKRNDSGGQVLCGLGIGLVLLGWVVVLLYVPFMVGAVAAAVMAVSVFILARTVFKENGGWVDVWGKPMIAATFGVASAATLLGLLYVLFIAVTGK